MSSSYSALETLPLPYSTDDGLMPRMQPLVSQHVSVGKITRVIADGVPVRQSGWIPFAGPRLSVR